MFRILYRLIAMLARLAVRSVRSKDLEIIVLRHQLTVLRCQVNRPTTHDADRTLLGAIAAALPRPRRTHTPRPSDRLIDRVEDPHNQCPRSNAGAIRGHLVAVPPLAGRRGLRLLHRRHRKPDGSVEDQSRPQPVPQPLQQTRKPSFATETANS